MVHVTDIIHIVHITIPVLAHEQEHVSNAYKKSTLINGTVINTSVIQRIIHSASNLSSESFDDIMTAWNKRREKNRTSQMQQSKEHNQLRYDGYALSYSFLYSFNGSLYIGSPCSSNFGVERSFNV